MNHHITQWNIYCDHLETLYTSGEDQISTTDPEAKSVILHRNIVNVGYNIHAISDAKHKLLIAMDAGTVNDTQQLSNMVIRSMDHTGTSAPRVLADKGYHTGAQISACEITGAVPFVSPKANATNLKYKVFRMEAFKYHHASDTYRCPADQILRTNGQYYQRQTKGKHPVRFKHYKTKACGNCPIKQQCTSSNRGRLIQRSEYQSAIDRNNKRVQRSPEYYRTRQQIIEHQFGTFKRYWHFDHVLIKGKEKVLGEISILFTIYNLRRSMSILRFSGLIEQIRAIFDSFFKFLNTGTYGSQGEHQLKFCCILTPGL